MPAKAAASAAAFVALVAVLAGVAFALSRGAPPPATTTTTTATTTTTVPDRAVAGALATALADGLEVPLTDPQAACLGDALVVTVGRARLEALAATQDPLASLPERDRAQLVRDVVACVGPEVAAALLAPSTTTTP